MGNSAGGNVVLNLVTMRPDLVKTAAVHEPGPFGLLEADPQLSELMEREQRLTDGVQGMIAGGEPRRAAEYFVDNVAMGPGAWEQFPDEMKAVLGANASTVADDLRDGRIAPR